VTLAHDDGTEVRALWQVEIDTARSYLRMPALMHADLPECSTFTLDLVGAAGDDDDVVVGELVSAVA
jgi:hypothetical protein